MHISSNVFLAGGTTTNSGFYAFGRAYLTATTLDAFATHEGVYPGTIATAAFADLIERGYVDYSAPYGFPSTTAHALTNISEFSMDSPTFDAYKTAIYDTLIATVALDDSIVSTRTPTTTMWRAIRPVVIPRKARAGVRLAGSMMGRSARKRPMASTGSTGAIPIFRLAVRSRQVFWSWCHSRVADMCPARRR